MTILPNTDWDALKLYNFPKSDPNNIALLMPNLPSQNLCRLQVKPLLDGSLRYLLKVPRYLGSYLPIVSTQACGRLTGLEPFPVVVSCRSYSAKICTVPRHV